jgi:excisionase family DNA binding protein
MDRETAESVAGVARLPRRAALLVSVRADQEGPWSPGAVLIIFSLLWMVSREPKLYLCMRRCEVMIIMENSATEMIFTPRWYTVAQVAQLLNYGESKVRMLIITGQLRSIKDGRSRRILPEWVEAYVKIAPRLPRTSGDESQSQRRRFGLSLPQWVRGLCLDYDPVREASAQVRLRTNTGDSPQPVDGAHCAVGQCCHRAASPRTIKDVRTVLRSGLNSAGVGRHAVARLLPAQWLAKYRLAGESIRGFIR